MDTFQKYYKNLNDEQKKAVDIVDGPLLILAGPGTGKTQLLSVRAANILKQKKADPSDILILTFTNAAARTMRARLAGIIGYQGYDIEVETFHSFANSIVLESEEALGHIKNKIEISEVEKIRAIEYILDNIKGTEALRPFGAPYINRSEIERRISELKNEDISPRGFAEGIKGLKPNGITLEDKHIPRLKALSVIYENYEKFKHDDPSVLFDERGRYDFDDMISLALEAMEHNPILVNKFKDRFKYIMVDEFQDTNGAQLKLLFSIINSGNNVCCVGDDDQAIYRFQGATLANFRKLSDRIPTINTVSLKKNYRSSADIIALSSKIISQISIDERIADKQLTAEKKYYSENISFFEFKTEEEELSFIIEQIKKQKFIIENDKSLTEEENKAPYNNIAILLRKRKSIKKIIDACLRAGIPYATDGKEDIRQEKRVRQMLDILELVNLDLVDPERKSLLLYSVLNADYLGVDPSDLLKFISFVNKRQKEEYLAYLNKKDLTRPKKAFSVSLFDAFFDYFYSQSEDGYLSAEKSIEISELLNLKKPEALSRAAWALGRMISEAGTGIVHDLILQYIEDTGLYQYILESYQGHKLIKIRELRALVSFINMIKDASNSDPGLSLRDFVREIELRNMHGMPIQGKLATMSQEGVRIFTAHGSKGLEFHTVMIPFCLEKKNWPARAKGDVVPLPPDIYSCKEKVKEKNMLKTLSLYDELRLFYVASTRAKANLLYTSTPQDKSVSTQFLPNAGINPKIKIFEEEIFLGEYISSPKKDLFTEKGTKKLLLNIVSEMSLNPTSVGTYISCKRRFLYNDILRLPGKKNQHLAFGNSVHEALDDVYSVYKLTGNFPSFDHFKNSFKKELFFQGLKPSVKNWCLDRLEGLNSWYRNESLQPVKPLELEQKIEIHFPQGFVFTGKFDKIEEIDKGIRVVDYKTGKPDKHVKSINKCKDNSRNPCYQWQSTLC